MPTNTFLIYKSIISLFLFGYEISLSRAPVLLIISFDGFRHDYFSRNITPHINKLRSEGTHSQFMNSVFPTKTFPNHFSIATGVFSEVHGVLSNVVYNNKTQKVLKYGYELFHYSEDVIPLWTLNEMHGEGRHSGCMMWPGSDYPYRNQKTTFVAVYNTSVPWEQRVDVVVSWMLHSQTPANLVFLYFEEPDSSGHAFGPDSQQVNEQIIRCDRITEYLMFKLTEHNLTSIVNIFMLSDHGMGGVPVSNIIDINSFVRDNTSFNMYGNSPVIEIHPTAGRFEEVVGLLKAGAFTSNFIVYKREEIPERWHYKRSGRAPPILAVADEGYAFNDLYATIDYFKQKFNISATPDTIFGVHGYDPTEPNMRPFFLATGPLIRRNFTVKPFNNVDLYPLVCEILGLEDNKAITNGSIGAVHSILRSVGLNSAIRNLYVVGGTVLGLMSLATLAVFLHLYSGTDEGMKSSNCNIGHYRNLDLSELQTNSSEHEALLMVASDEDHEESV